MNNDVDKYKNAFNSNIENNVTRKRRPTPVISRFPEREIHLAFLNKVKILSQDVPSTASLQFVLIEHVC